MIPDGTIAGGSEFSHSLGADLIEAVADAAPDGVLAAPGGLALQVFESGKDMIDRRDVRRGGRTILRLRA